MARGDNGMRIPKDLVALPLTMPQVQKILTLRATQRKFAARIAGLPKKADKYAACIDAARTEEQTLMGEAQAAKALADDRAAAQAEQAKREAEQAASAQPLEAQPTATEPAQESQAHAIPARRRR